MSERPKVGVGVIIVRDNKILLGKRKNAHGDGTWSPPGGHLEYGESWEEGGAREIMEETGMTVKNIRFSTVTNDIFPIEEKHYITLIMLADYDSGEAKIMEPEKWECWQWFEWGKLPQPLFIPIQNLLKTNYNPFKIN